MHSKALIVCLHPSLPGVPTPAAILEDPYPTPRCHVSDHLFTLWETSFWQTINVASSSIRGSLGPIRDSYGALSYDKPVYLGLLF